MFALTPEERKIILFLITMALIGTGINFFSKRYSTVKNLLSFPQNIAKIDLNKADKEMLMNIPGIGEKLAQRIIDYRMQKSGFSDLEELKNIRGITDYRYEKIKNFFYLP